jgi:hypothetical protein
MSSSFCLNRVRRRWTLLKGEKMRKSAFLPLRKENEDAWERAWSNVSKEVEKVRWERGLISQNKESFQK